MSWLAAAQRRAASIQVRITVVATVTVLVLLSVAAFGVIARFESQVMDQVDRELAADAAVVQRSIDSGTIPALRRSGALVDLIVQVVDPTGAVVQGASTGADVPALAAPSTLEPDRSRRHLTIDVDGVGPVRVVVEAIPERRAVLVIGQPIDQTEDAIDSLRRLALVVVPLIGLLVAGLVWWVVGRALRPVEAVRRSVESITEQDLSQRVETPRTDDELAQLVVTMNSMLDRVEHGVERERRFVTDASHELRSPLAGARALLETESEELDEVVESRAHALATIARLEHVVNQMLQLARVDGTERSPRRLVDIDELVLAQANRMRRSGDLEIDTTGVSGGQLRGDENELGRVIENLTANAARHAHSKLRFGVVEHNGVVRLTVEDDGAGVPYEERSRVFQRFARLDDSRVRDAGGTGLGLSIVAAIVSDHGGTITVDDSPLGGARFIAELPRSS